MSKSFYHQDLGYYTLQIGTPLKPIILILKKRLLFILFTIPMILLFAAFTGRLFASRILKPVMEVTQTARNITHENLNDRVKAEHIDEEMMYLVDAFNDMIARLERSFEYIAEFSSHVAHELKTPLAIIRGEAEIALRKEREPKEYRRVIHITLEESQRMLKCIEDLLLYTKLTHNPEAFTFEQIEMVSFLREVSEQIKVLAAPKDIMIKSHLPEDYQLTIRGDNHYLRRLFFNLIDNAIKFTPQKGKITIAADSTYDSIRISVSDTGPGIAKDEQHKLFQKFSRGNQSHSQKVPGVGLGLNIAQTIARIHNGYIHLDSEIGKGSVFTVTLPLDKSPSIK